jgi:hypothetical protein
LSSKGRLKFLEDISDRELHAATRLAIQFGDGADQMIQRRPLREEAVCAGGGRRGPFLSGRVTLAQGTAA